jgi:hypothetical protein
MPLSNPEVREHAPRIVREMVTDAGTKHPRSETELAEKTRLDAHLIRGTLLALGGRGLVRPLDEANRVWEIAHDFVARLLSQIVGNVRVPWWRRAQPWLAPTALVLWVGVIFLALPAWQALVARDAFQALAAMDIRVAGGNPYRVQFPRPENEEQAQVGLVQAMPHLRALGPLELELPSISNLDPLANLTSLQSLDLGDTQVADLGPLANLTSLQSLSLWSTQVADLEPLANLTSLQLLNLSGTQVADLGPLANLTSLQSLVLYATQVDDLGPLAELTSLQSLALGNTQVVDLGPLANLTSLQSLDLGYTQLADLGPLATLTSLRSLYLGKTRVPEQHIADLRAVFAEREQEVNIMR